MLNLFFAFSSLLSSTGILSLYIRYNDLFAGKTDTPFFFFGGDLWRVGLIKKIFFWLCEPFGRHVLRWSGSVTNRHYFLLLSQTYVLGNVRSELFLVYGCQLFMFLCCFCLLQQTFILLFILPYF